MDWFDLLRVLRIRGRASVHGIDDYEEITQDYLGVPAT